MLTSLDGCPQHITGNFFCHRAMITSLVGGPRIVDGDYDCYSNRLTDLDGCASHIGGSFVFWSNPKLTSLVGVHKIIKSCKSIQFSDNRITQGGIGLLLIDNLTEITDKTLPFEIISKYIGTGAKGILRCQNELIEMGYPNNAKL